MTIIAAAGPRTSILHLTFTDSPNCYLSICRSYDMLASATYGHPKKKSSSHKAYKGDSGYKGYKGKKSGKKGSSKKASHFSKKGSKKKGHHDKKKYYGDMKKGNKGHKAAKYGKKGHHHKGHKTKGFKNTYHKNEYSKKTKFYDSFDNGGYHKKYGGYKGYYGGSKGSKYKGGKDKAGWYGDKYGKKGHDHKGKHHDAHKGEKGHYGHKGGYGSKSSKGKGGYHDHHHGYGRSLPAYDAPEATTTKFRYARRNPKPTTSPVYDYDDDYYSDYGDADYRDRQADYRDDTFGNYDGYDYGLEKAQEKPEPVAPKQPRQRPPTPRAMPRPRPTRPPKPLLDAYGDPVDYRDSYGDDYDDGYGPHEHFGSFGQGSKGRAPRRSRSKIRRSDTSPPPVSPSGRSLESSTEPAAYYDDYDSDNYYVPREPRDEDSVKKASPLRRPKVKDVNFYHDLSDPQENRKGYQTGYYKSWDSKDPRQKKSVGRKNKSSSSSGIAQERRQRYRKNRKRARRMDQFADHPFSGFHYHNRLNSGIY